MVTVLLVCILIPSGCNRMPDGISASENYGVDSDIRCLTLIKPPVGNFFWAEVEAGMKEAAASNDNIDIRVISAAGRSQEDYEKCFSMAILTQPDGIFSICVSDDIMRDSFLKVKDAGIPLVLVGVDTVDTSLRDGCCGINNWHAGEIMGEHAAQLCGGEANILIASSTLDSSGMLDRIAGFESAIRDYPGMRIINSISTQSDETHARFRIVKVLQGREKVTMIVTLDGISARGAVQAIQTTHKYPYMLTFDADAPIPDMLEAGTIQMALVLDGYDMGRNAVKMMLQILDDEPVNLYYSDVKVLAGQGVDK